MFLQPGSVPPTAKLYRGQSTIQLILIMIAAICVPWLLIAKPYLIWKEMHKTQGQGGYMTLGHDESPSDDVPQQTPGVLAEEEGRALIQTDEEESVSFIHFVHPCLCLD